MSSPTAGTSFAEDLISVFPEGFEDSADLEVIPFKAIHNPPSKFASSQRKVFIPNRDIKVKILEYERNVSYTQNPNLYTIQITHGNFAWIIKKRYKHIHHLHQQLKLYRATVNIPFPSKVHRDYRTSFRRDLTSTGKKIKKPPLPRCPSKVESTVAHEDLDQRIKELEEYLNTLLKIKFYRNHHETINFLEVSNLSFVNGLGDKGKEGVIQKKMGSTRPGQGTCNFCGLLDNSLCVRCKYILSNTFGKWENRWLFVKDSCVGYINPKDGSVKCVLLFDAGFGISSGTCGTDINCGMQITNLSRQLAVKCWTPRKRQEWISYIKDIACNKANDFTQRNRYNSFAPNRKSMQAVWFVDGSAYLAAVADALESAKEEIFIADWWLSPEIYMKRPILGDTWRLDTILKRKAEQGVKIFVLLYKEVEFAMELSSGYSKQCLAKIHKNIKVLRHPDHTKSGVYFWAHHEKIVVIDQTYAFLGGIDLCYGRWDDHDHRLTDLGNVPQTYFSPSCQKYTSSSPKSETNQPKSLIHLAVTSNIVTLAPLCVSSPNLHRSLSVHQNIEDESLLKSASMFSLHSASESEMTAVTLGKLGVTGIVTPSLRVDRKHSSSTILSKMPLEDTKYDSSIKERRSLMVQVHHASETVKLKGKEFMNKLHRRTDTDSNREIKEIVNESVHIVEHLEDHCDYVNKEKDVNDSTATEENEISRYHKTIHETGTSVAGRSKLWVGKDYINFIVKDPQDLDSPFEDLVDRNTTPRMPWHDIGMMVQGAAARDVARHFIQRWNAVKVEKAKFNFLFPYLIPKSYYKLDKIKPIILARTRCVDCQVVRSIAQWSGGFLDADTKEEGIHEAYVDVITNSKHYIYIENQFFITCTSTSTSVRNQVGDALFKRILKAHKENAVFRVYVVMPLLPGFEGDIGSPSTKALHTMTHWNYSSICKGNEALLNRLREAGINEPMEYISFYGLRTHSILNGDLVSELIYVHSKLLIADDDIVICGSANINDRSLIGERDSEIAVVLKDCEFEEGIMNGNSFKTGKFAGSLRSYLFKEHLGILTDHSKKGQKIDIKDPIAASFYHDTWRKIAAENTKIYEEVFHCLPSDKTTCFLKLKQYKEEVPLCLSNRVAANKLLSNIQGHLVCLPLDFLKNKDLTPNLATVEGILPSGLWT